MSADSEADRGPIARGFAVDVAVLDTDPFAAEPRSLLEARVAAGFEGVTIDRYRVHTPFLPFNTHIAGVAQA